MSWQSESKQCKLACPWTGTEMCVLSQLTPEILASHHVTLGVMCGIKATYESHHLPPCITEDGFLEWKLPQELLGAEAARQRETAGQPWME